MKVLAVLIVLAVIAFGGYRAYLARQTESKEARTLGSLPATVRHVVAQMDATSQAAFFNEYERKKRRSSVAYAMWMLCGAHYLYLRQTGLQVAFWVFGGGCGTWWLYCLFCMPRIVGQANEQIAREALQTMHVGAVFAQLGGMQSTTPAGAALPRPATPPPATSAVPPTDSHESWRTDPTGRHDLRWWDGSAWSSHVSDGEVRSVDPL